MHFFHRRRKRLQRADTNPAGKQFVTTDPFNAVDITSSARVEDSNRKLFPDEEFIPMLDTPHLILDAEGARTSGQMCPACLELKNQVVEHVYGRGSGRLTGRENFDAPSSAMSSCSATSGVELDRTIPNNRILYALPPVQLR